MSTGGYIEWTWPWRKPLPGGYDTNGPTHEISFVREGVNFLVRPTGDTGFNTGRGRFYVECTTCRTVLHENTTGPAPRIESHLKDVHQDPLPKRSFEPEPVWFTEILGPPAPGEELLPTVEEDEEIEVPWNHGAEPRTREEALEARNQLGRLLHQTVPTRTDETSEVWTVDEGNNVVIRLAADEADEELVTYRMEMEAKLIARDQEIDKLRKQLELARRCGPEAIDNMITMVEETEKLAAVKGLWFAITGGDIDDWMIVHAVTQHANGREPARWRFKLVDNVPRGVLCTTCHQWFGEAFKTEREFLLEQERVAKEEQDG